MDEKSQPKFSCNWGLILKLFELNDTHNSILKVYKCYLRSPKHRVSHQKLKNLYIINIVCVCPSQNSQDRPEGWENCSCSCYVRIFLLHYPLVGTPNASLTHSPQTVEPPATYWLPPATCQFFLPEIFFAKKNSPDFFTRKTQNWVRRASLVRPKALDLHMS